MAFDIDTSVYDDIVIKDKQKIPRFYVPVYDDTAMYVTGFKPVHTEYSIYNEQGNVKNLITKTGVPSINMTEHYDTLNDTVVIVVECRIPSGTTLIHDEEDTMTLFAEGIYSMMQYQREIPDLEEWVKKLMAMDEVWVNECDCGRKMMSMKIGVPATPNLSTAGVNGELVTPNGNVGGEEYAPLGDSRDEICERILKYEYNDLVRKPLNSQWKTYKQGKSAFPVLFRPYLYNLIAYTVKHCPPKLLSELRRENEKTSTRGRKPLTLEDYTFSFIDKVENKKDNLQHHTIIKTQLYGKYVGRTFRPEAYTKYTNKKVFGEFMQLLIENSARMFQKHEHIFAVDSSGFRTTQMNEYYAEKHHKEKENDWCDAHIIVGVNSNIATSALVGKKYGIDELKALPYLVKRTQKQFLIDVLLGDGGYLSEQAMILLNRKYGVRLFAPIQKNANLNPVGKSEEWVANVRANLSDMWDEFYHARSNVETTFNCVKRMTEETINATGDDNKYNELYAKILINNIKLQVIYYFVADLRPEYMHKSEIEKILVETHFKDAEDTEDTSAN